MRGERAWRSGGALGVALALAGIVTAASPALAADRAASGNRDGARIERIEDHMRALQEELAELKQDREVSAAKVAEVEEELSGLQRLLSRVKVGGYGSARYEASSLDDQQNTFTFRRLVFTTDASLHERLRFYSELEYERFRKLELEREVTAESGGLRLKQAVEGTTDSEIALEQAWLEYEIDPAFCIRAGGVLVPLGRFNINHDDNQWNLPRRSLVDRGANVLPAPAAWDELGVGFTGGFELGRGHVGYQAYVVNGVTIDAELEEIAQTRAGRRDKLELEAEFTPQTGTFSNDSKEAKAFTGRLAWAPEEGHEIGFSFYTGRYTPDYLTDEHVTSFAIDGITRFAGLELEGQLATTNWGGLVSVAKSFASRALDHSSFNSSAFDPTLEPEIEFELANLAKRKTGYWLELRYPFWPSFLPQAGFDDPKLIPVARMEQVWMNDRLVELGFSGGNVSELATDDEMLGRFTLGLAFRPVPLVAFTAAYEYAWAGHGSLMGLTNYMPANEDESDAHSFLMGVSYGF